MSWNIEYTDQFEEWWEKLSLTAQEDVVVMVERLEEQGPHLRFPYSSGVVASRHPHMRELRIQHKGEPPSHPLRWYEKYVPLADDLYDSHLEELQREENES